LADPIPAEDYAPRRAPRHQFLQVRGIRHRLTCWGPAEAPPIVLLHGWLDTGATWQFLVDCLPDGWAFVAPDWRGFGGSERAASGYWFPDYFADLEVLLDALSPGEPARVIGHSMGGNIASMYGGIRPQRLQWLVNLEGMGLPRTKPDQAPERYAKWLEQWRAPADERRYPSVEQLAAVLCGRNPRLTKARARFIARSWSREETTGVALAFDPRHRFVNPVLYRREETEGCWRRFEAPQLMVFGAESELRKRMGADASDEFFSAVFRNLRIATLPDVGHMMHHEDPDAVARLILDFVESLP
jgi:pimeloyl-ACP methyl ester carboxylesterase